MNESHNGCDRHIVLNDVMKTFDSGPETLTILNNVNICVDKGDTVGITGESGSGKSTLLNLIAGLDAPSAGTVDCAGYRVSHAREDELTEYRRRIVGLIFQFHYLLRDFTAVENVMMPARVAGVSRKDAQTRALELLRRVGLEHRLYHEPARLSGGERQRVALARALINGPDVLLADEPTGNLDERNSRVVESLLFELVAETGATLLVVTHDDVLAGRCNHSLALSGGAVEGV